MSEAAQAAPPADPPAAEPEKSKAPTAYLILYFDEEVGGWIEGPKVKARTPRKALEDALEGLTKDKEGVSKFVAVPARYWNVEEPGVETTTRIVFK